MDRTAQIRRNRRRPPTRLTDGLPRIFGRSGSAQPDRQIGIGRLRKSPGSSRSGSHVDSCGRAAVTLVEVHVRDASCTEAVVSRFNAHQEIGPTVFITEWPLTKLIFSLITFFSKGVKKNSSKNSGKIQ